MSKSWRGKKDEKDAERLLQEAFGVSEDQILRDFITAQTEVKDSDIPPEPEDGFERLMAKLNAEMGTDPEKEEHSSGEKVVNVHEEIRKPRRLKTVVKVSLAVAAVAVMIGAMGISAGAKREYRYVVREKDDLQKMVLNNVDTHFGDDELEKAYAEITKKTDIQPMKLIYRPDEMEFIKAEIGKTWAVMYFEYGKHRIKLLQQKGDIANSVNIVSDRKKQKMVYNELLKQEIYIEEAKTEDGEIEYSSSIVKGDMYYQFFGIMPQREFEKIIKNLSLERY